MTKLFGNLFSAEMENQINFVVIKMVAVKVLLNPNSLKTKKKFFLNIFDIPAPLEIYKYKIICTTHS
jgi:hypothetical protein